jgi:hypothetical protein
MAPNDEIVVTFDRTYRFKGTLDETARARMISVARGVGATLTFGTGGDERTYAVASNAKDLVIDAQEAYDEIVIALSIEPTPEDALPSLVRACAAAGAPIGILSCEAVGGTLFVETRPASAPSVTAMLQVEMRRLGGFARTRLLTPLSAETAVAIAAAGTACPDLTSKRVLETLVADAGLV